MIDDYKITGGSLLAQTYIGNWDNPKSSKLVALDMKTGKSLWECGFDVYSIQHYMGISVIDSFEFGETRSKIIRIGDKLYIPLSYNDSVTYAVMDLKKAERMLAEGKKWW